MTLALIDLPYVPGQAKRQKFDIVGQLDPNSALNLVVDKKWRKFLFYPGARVVPNEKYWNLRVKKHGPGQIEDKSIKFDPELVGSIESINLENRTCVVTWNKSDAGPGEKIDGEKFSFRYSIGLKKIYHLDFA